MIGHHGFLPRLYVGLLSSKVTQFLGLGVWEHAIVVFKNYDTNNAHLLKKNQPGQISFLSSVQIFRLICACTHPVFYIYHFFHTTFSYLRPPIPTPSSPSADCFASYFFEKLNHSAKNSPSSHYKHQPAPASATDSLDKQLWAGSQGLSYMLEPLPSCFLENMLSQLSAFISTSSNSPPPLSDRVHQDTNMVGMALSINRHFESTSPSNFCLFSLLPFVGKLLKIVTYADCWTLSLCYPLHQCQAPLTTIPSTSLVNANDDTR